MLGSAAALLVVAMAVLSRVDVHPASFKPSAIHDDGVHYGLSLRERGVPLVALLSDDHWSRARWHKTSFKSFLGLYGYRVPQRVQR